MRQLNRKMLINSTYRHPREVQHKQRALEGVVATGLCSQRWAYRYLGLHRSSIRYEQSADGLAPAAAPGSGGLLEQTAEVVWATATWGCISG
jgi:hypothetical protein